MDREERKRRANARLKARRDLAKRQKAGQSVSHHVSESEDSESSQDERPAAQQQGANEDNGGYSRNDERAEENDIEHNEGIRRESPAEEYSGSDASDSEGESEGHSSNDDRAEGNVIEHNEGFREFRAEEYRCSDVSDSEGESEDMDYYPPSEESRADSEASAGAESEDDNNSDSSDEDDCNGDGNEPIYPGATITLHESLVAIFTILFVENLSGKLVSSILQLIALHCPEGSIVKRTLATFKSYFSKLGSSLIVRHYLCGDCIFPLKTKTSVCPKCKKNDSVSYFLELPLLDQLQTIFKRENFHDDLQFRFKADRKRNRNNIEDIYDGQIYKEQMENGFLQNPHNISFMWYSDGVSIFKSSGFSIWPLCLVINELPYKLRTLPKNILLVGVWFGKTKPNPNLFLKPLYGTMKSFEKDGHQFRLFDNSEILVKGKLLCGTCDMPAKCKFLCMKQFNASFGCPKCMAEGGRAVAGKTTVQVYPYQPNIAKRTHAQAIEFAKQALEARKTDRNASVFGVKGPSLLSKMVPDIIKSTGIDVMHGIFLGVFKMLLNLWFSSTFSGMPWSVHHLVDVLDEKLCKVKSPSFTERAPRSLKDIKFWKASEYKQFMLYYCVPLLKSVLEDAYFKHNCILVSATCLLNQDSISLDQIQAASALLKSYVSEFPRLYPLRFLGINVHQLVHLADDTLELGPCWVFSCFFLENFNGVINKMFHGTQKVALQVCSTVSMMVKIPEFRSRLPADSKVKEFCLRAELGAKKLKIADVIDGCTVAVGKYSYDLEINRHSANVVRQRLRKVGGTCCAFFRLQKRGVLYFAEEYPRKSSRKESSYITFQEDNTVKVGRILRFVRWSNCRNVCDTDCRVCPVNYLAVIRVFERQFWFIHEMRNIRLSHISQIRATDNITAIDVQSVLGLCFYFVADDVQYIASQVNRLERE